MLDKLFGGYTAEKVLMFLNVCGEGYAREIERNMGLPFYPVNRQLARLEDAGVPVSIMKGRTKVFVFNPRYPFLNELKALLSKAYEYTHQAEKQRFYTERKRPRKSDKPF
jgi:hypothetical protein